MSLLKVLFPQVRAEILRLLFADPDRELHLRDLARQTGLSLKTVQNELAKLLEADLVTSSRDGNRRYYRANSSHPLFVDLHQIVLKTSGLRDVLVETLSGVKDIEAAFVFGSLASGKDNGGSDVDLMVIGDVSLRTLASRLRKAAEQLGREINPVTLSMLEFSKNRQKSSFLIDVMNKEKLFIKGGLNELG